MHVQEQRAWFVLIVMLSAFALYGIVIAVVGFHPAAFSVFAVGGIGGFAFLIGSGKKNHDLLVMDERDREISRLSIQCGFSVFWPVFILSMMAPMLILGPDATVTMKASGIAAWVFPPMILVFLVQALTTIILYRRGGDGE